jgi:hypothetical protein
MTNMLKHPTADPADLRTRLARFRQERAEAVSNGLRDGRVTDHFVSETRVVRVEATPAATMDAFDRIKVGDRLLGAVHALGFGERLTAAPDPPPEAGTARGTTTLPGAAAERVCTLSWRLGEGTVVTARWELRAKADGEEGVLLSATTRFLTSDAAARERLHTAWGIIGPLARELSRRWLAAIATLAEETSEPT